MRDFRATVTAITESGSEYRLDTKNQFWDKNGMGWEKIIRLYVSDEEGMGVGTPRRDPAEWREATLPEVGHSLFISSLRVWWRSTPVVELIFHGDSDDDED